MLLLLLVVVVSGGSLVVCIQCSEVPVHEFVSLGTSLCGSQSCALLWLTLQRSLNSYTFAAWGHLLERQSIQRHSH